MTAEIIPLHPYQQLSDGELNARIDSALERMHQVTAEAEQLIRESERRNRCLGRAAALTDALDGPDGGGAA